MEIPEVRAESERLAAEAREQRDRAAALHVDATSSLAEVGRSLLALEAEWLFGNPSARPPFRAARKAIARVEELDGVVRSSPGSKFGIFRRRQKPIPGVQPERQAREADSRSALATLGRRFGGALPTLVEAHAQAMQMEVRSRSDGAAAAKLQRASDTLAAEASVREQAVAELGFDAPLLAARLHRSGAGNVPSPLELRPGEVAYAAAKAELAREKTFAAAAPSGSRPELRAEITGIPFLLGTRRSAPARDTLSILGPGTFVVTDQRLGFVGPLKSFSFPLGELARVEYFPTGLSLLRADRANADVVITAEATRLLFYINWVRRGSAR
ncbi:MAG: hypothetical protein ABR573_10640 [Candidatus Dormibacteria bacterium]